MCKLSIDDFEEKARRLFGTLKPEERGALIGCKRELAEDEEDCFVYELIDDVCNSDVVQLHYRFLPEDLFFD